MYNSSQTQSKDVNPAFSSPFKHVKEEELQKGRDAMASDLAQQQLNSNLIRFRSAPGPLLANFMDGSGDGCDEAESMFERFMSSSGGELESEIGSKMEQEAEAIQQQNGFSSASQMIYQINSMPNHSSAIESSYRNSMTVGMGSPQAKNSSNCSNLIRHSSSPAGLFSHLTAENGFAVMSRMDNFRGENCSDAEATASTSRFKHQMSILSRQASSPGMLSQISEVGSESVGANSPDDRNLGNGSRNANAYIPRFPISSWDDSPLENFTGLKRVRDIDGKLISNLNPSERQNGDVGGRTSGLTHQFSLPNTSSEISAMEKFLQFQESVPCKIRAKRGCATHPRSIAERVRRTRISERMRKLQELVPNMDKQTNTADMLDLAVEYIKDLQGQVKLLSDNQASCTCLSKRKPYPNAAV